MDRTLFLRRADECLARVQRWVEALDPDEVDFSTTDGVVTLEFLDKVRYVLNRQTATSQMWLAAGARAWHYDFDETRGEWLDDRDRHELFAKIGEVVSAKIGRAVTVAS